MAVLYLTGSPLSGSTTALGGTLSYSSHTSGGANTTGSTAEVSKADAQQFPESDPRVSGASNASVLNTFELSALRDGWYLVQVTLGTVILTRRVYIDAVPPQIKGRLVLLSSGTSNIPQELLAAGSTLIESKAGTVLAILETNFTEPVVFKPDTGIVMQGAILVRYKMSADNMTCISLLSANAGSAVSVRVATDAYHDLSRKRGANALELQADSAQVGEP